MFPALRSHVWLNTAGVPPGALPVLAAVRAALADWESGDFDWAVWEGQAEDTRGLFAQLIGAPPESVALVSSLAEAAATIAHCVPPGRVVVLEREFRSNLFPWLALADSGCELRLVRPAAGGVVTTQMLIDAIDEGTVLVAVSDVQSNNGYRIRTAAVAERCRAVGSRLFVNLTQSLGALRFDVSAAAPDFVAVHGYKWLLAPRGAGWLYVRPDRLPEIAPLAPNWKSVAEPTATLYGPPYDLAADARKLDVSLAWLSWVGARAALILLGGVGATAIEARCLNLSRDFRAGAAAQGWEPVAEELPSHLVGIAMPDAAAVAGRMGAAGVVVSARDGFLRLGFHAFNNRADVGRALQALGRGPQTSSR